MEHRVIWAELSFVHDYQTIKIEAVSILEVRVNQMIEKGWKPIGGIATSFNYFKQKTLYTSRRWNGLSRVT
jgi:hypothetical protein